MAIKLNENTNFTHKKTAMLSGADFRFVLRLRALIKIIMKNPLGCQGAFCNYSLLILGVRLWITTTKYDKKTCVDL